MKDSSDGRPWYKTWSQLTKTSTLEPSVVVCFEDDGRVAVNTELCVASKIYAAGSVAKYPNSATGYASVAGEGTMDGAIAGRIAALNMAREFESKHGLARQEDSDYMQSFASCSVPVWRSDVTSYLSQSIKGELTPSSLSGLGVQALCVGQCDSERMSTRGFWWTNASAYRKIMRLIGEEEEVEDESSTWKLRRRITRQRRRKLGLVQPIYGIGVVYYLDKVGQIRGIMLWGLPFAKKEAGELNQELLNRVKNVVITNGGISALDSEENFHLVNEFLARESQRLVALAVKGQTQDTTGIAHGLDGAIPGFSRPLYRYTEARPPKNTQVTILKRKEGDSLGVLGEGLYARDQLAMEEETLLEQNEREEEYSNLPNPTYPLNILPWNLVSNPSPNKIAGVESLEELNRYLAVQRGWEDNENRARPGKEDPLWLRPGDEKRNMSQKQILIDYYRSIMFPHRSS